MICPTQSGLSSTSDSDTTQQAIAAHCSAPSGSPCTSAPETMATIGIGAGPGCDGQILVMHDMLGLNSGHRRPRFVKDFLAGGGSVAGAGITVLAAAWLVAAADIEPRAALGWVFFRIGASVMSAALGESVRSRRVITADALERAELAERTRDEEARARVAQERLRIAREVHDTVAHAIAVINVQA